MLRLENIKIREDLKNDVVLKKACIKNKVKIEDVEDYIIFKKSIDARKKEDVHYNYTIDIKVKDEKKYPKLKSIKNIEKLTLKFENKRISNKRPVIIGAGPAGLFCALTLVENGIRPIIIEQGKPVEERIKDVDNFFKNGKLNTRSNVQFGEGGAGTFSDGKLTTGISNILCKNVLQEFVKFGAPEQILYVNKPHIGTDNLIHIVRNMRKYIEQKGGGFLFNEKVEEFDFKDNKINSVSCSKELKTDTVVLAIGHSARDTIKTLLEKNVEIKLKNFAIGVRIEHKQEMINKAQYGEITKLKLPPAEYKLVHHATNGRTCYTFCMCPGGTVVGSSSDENTIVTNGMSTYARDKENANSGLLVNVAPEDFKAESVLEAMEFQKQLEEKAFVLGGKNYNAPIQRVEDFLNNKKTEYLGEVKPSFTPGVEFANLQEILPEFITETLKEGIINFDKKLKGFANKDAILTGVETRSSSTVTILRNEDLMSTTIKGLYPCGEGAGYAGGIMSAAVDGIKCGMKILDNEEF